MRDFILTIGAVLIGLILLALGGIALSGGFHTGTASNIVSEIAIIQSNARKGFMQNNLGYTNFTTANSASLASGGTFPTNLVRNGVVYDDWGNQIKLASAQNATQGVITFGGGGSQTVDQCTTVLTSIKDYISLVAVGSVTFTQAAQPDGVTAANACAGNPAIQVTFQ